jgi:hypothetical protein
MKKNIVLIALILSVVFLLVGCAPAPTTPPNTQPTTYTIKVISGCGDCYGNVYVNGVPSGAYLIPWGAANISGVPAGAAIRLEDEWGYVSHTEYFNPMFGTNVVFDRFF